MPAQIEEYVNRANQQLFADLTNSQDDRVLW
jgi:hypothetical protein